MNRRHLLSLLALCMLLLAGCSSESETRAPQSEKPAVPEGPEVNPTSGRLEVGASIAEVQAANGKPFKIYGFEIDSYLAGSIMSWEGGKLAGRFVQFQVTKPDGGFDYGAIIGDSGLLSNNPILTKAGLEVSRLEPMPPSDEY